MAYFPVMINIENKRVLVVGGGQEGKQKVKVLSMFGAIVTVVAKEVSDGIDDIADTGETLIHYKQRGYKISTMFYNRGVSAVKPDLYMREKKDLWIVYPWEVKE